MDTYTDRQKIRIMNGNMICFVCLLIMFTFGLNQTGACEGDTNGAVRLKVRPVLLNPECKSYPNFERGAPYVKDYKSLGVTDCFLIGTEAIMSFGDSDISSIKINMEKLIGDIILDCCVIDIILNKSSSKQIEHYTNSNMGKKIALDIDGTIIAVPTIMDTIQQEMKIIACETSLEEVRAKLLKITNKVTIK